MKIAGQEPSGPAEEVLVLPRANGDIVFTAQAVMDMTEFHALCPAPKAPGRMVAGGKWEANTDSPSYRAQVEKLAEMRMAYIVINSLQDVEWDTVEHDKPNTWLNWQTDLQNNHFNENEIQRILILCMQANCLDEVKLKAARDAFLLGQGLRQAKFSGQNTEQESTQSGKPARDSESVLQELREKGGKNSTHGRKQS